MRKVAGFARFEFPTKFAYSPALVPAVGWPRVGLPVRLHKPTDRRPTLECLFISKITGLVCLFVVYY